LVSPRMRPTELFPVLDPFRHQHQRPPPPARPAAAAAAITAATTRATTAATATTGTTTAAGAHRGLDRHRDPPPRPPGPPPRPPPAHQGHDRPPPRPATTTVATATAVVCDRGHDPPPRLGGASSGLMMSERKPSGMTSPLVDPAFDGRCDRSSCGPRRSRSRCRARRRVQRHATVGVAFGPRHLGHRRGGRRPGPSRPLAPERIAEVQRAFSSPGRKATRFCSCSAIDWATSFGVELGPFDLADVHFQPGCR